MSAVSIRNLSVGYGGQTVIGGLDLEVAEGEFLVLLGPSGCGKSTLLHAIAGLNEVSGGRLEIGGRDMTDADPTDRNIGMVFQSYALYPTMSVAGNMSFGLRIKGLPKAEIAERVRRTAALLQLEPLLERKPAQLSGGQRQRVAIGRALVREAGVCLFDEPLSNLDAKLRGELRRELKMLHRNLRSTMIYVTHDQVEAMTLADRIVVMKEGRIQQIGTPAEVYERPENLFVAGFLGAPAINRVPGHLAGGAGGWVFRSPQFDLDLAGYPFRAAPADGQAAVLGVRPEQLRLGAPGRLAGSVSLVEPMGNHQVVWIDCQGLPLAAVVRQADGLLPDQPVALDIDATRVSLFDPAGEGRL